MTKRVSLICVLIMLLVLTSVASASPLPPKKFRIKGQATSVNLQGFPFVIGLTSEGKVIRHFQGTFAMDEYLALFPLGSSGTLTITTKKDGRVVIWFEGTSDLEQETVWGDFSVIYGTRRYKDLTGGGTYEGEADSCELPCDPMTDEACRGIYEPDCDGFYVDFTFSDGD